MAGESVAVTVLLACIHSRLRAHLERRLPRDLQPFLDVDDLIQETQIRVFHNINSFRLLGADAFYRWVATIAMHNLRNTIKAQRTLKRGGAKTLSGNDRPDGLDSLDSLLNRLIGPENSPSHHASRNEATDALAAALAHLPEHYRQAIRLVYLEGRPVEEAARIMGRTDRAIHNLCYKAKEMLHVAMGSTSRFFSRP